MDPNATLARIRELITAMHVTAGTTRVSAFDAYANQAAELEELVEALDGWLTNGGFLPTGWRSDAQKAWQDGKDLGYSHGFADGYAWRSSHPTTPACAPQAHQTDCDHRD